jgi:hypothetical protein
MDDKVLEKGMAKVVSDREFLDWAKRITMEIFPTSAQEYHKQVLQQYEFVENYKNILDKLGQENK